jgi:hypothetical protein
MPYCCKHSSDQHPNGFQPRICTHSHWSFPRCITSLTCVRITCGSWNEHYNLHLRSNTDWKSCICRLHWSNSTIWKDSQVCAKLRSCLLELCHVLLALLVAERDFSLESRICRFEFVLVTCPGLFNLLEPFIKGQVLALRGFFFDFLVEIRVELRSFLSETLVILFPCLTPYVLFCHEIPH